MSYKQVPITAKILKTTKGGVTQPILNMGAPVKMKASSPAKQTGSFGEEYQKRMSEKKEAAKQKRAEAGKNIYNKKLDQYKKDVAIADKSWDGKGKKNNIARDRAESFSKELFDFDNKNYPNRTKGFKTATDYAKSKKIKTTKKVEVAGNVKGKLKPGEGVLKSPKQKAKLTKKQESFIKDPTGGVTKPPKTKSTKITGKIGSDLRRQQYKDKGWADDATTMKPKVKAANTIKAKKGVDVKKARTTSLETKLDPKATKTQVAKVNSKKAEPSKGNVRKANRKLDSADRKDSRAARVSQKAKEARASGNTAKADRLKRREARINKRAAKKRGQAASAIQPK